MLASCFRAAADQRRLVAATRSNPDARGPVKPCSKSLAKFASPRLELPGCKAWAPHLGALVSCDALIDMVRQLGDRLTVGHRSSADFVFGLYSHYWTKPKPTENNRAFCKVESSVTSAVSCRASLRQAVLPPQRTKKRPEAARRSFAELGTTKAIRRTSLSSGLLNRLLGVARQTSIHLTELRQLGNMGFISHSGVPRLDLDLPARTILLRATARPWLRYPLCWLSLRARITAATGCAGKEPCDQLLKMLIRLEGAHAF